MKKKCGKLLLALLLLLALPGTALAADSQKLIAITFDDGPSKYTDNLLDELAKRQVVVTFFMQGYNAERYSSTVQKAYAAGHQIASHTYNHPYLTKLSATEVQNQVKRTAGILDAATGASGGSYMLRPPYGSYNAQVLAQIGVPAILWSVDTLDWKSRNAEAVYQNIVSNSRDGSIVLLHDLYPTTVQGALRGIDYLQAQGYELVTVQELLRRRGIAAEAGHTYSSAYNKGTTLPGLTPPKISYDPSTGYLTLTADASIYYLLNGSAPTPYTEPVYAGGSRPLEITAFAAYNLNGGRSRQSRLLISQLGNCFVDIQANDWYYEDVDRAVAAGLLTTDNGYFYPNAVVTQQSAAILINRMTENPLTEVLSTLNDNEPLTRQRLAQLLYQAHQLLGQPGLNLAPPSPEEALKWAAAQGIFSDTLQPTATVTRGELAAIALRCSSVIH